VFSATTLCAQISPGDLTKAHAHLEGIANCTKCHVLGDKVTNAKCLDCHTEIKSRVDQRKGFHSSSEVVGKDCFACHSEHHGRNFEIVRFDTEKFNHNLTGYKLTGAHMEQDCKACHNDEHIQSAELRKKEETFLGLSTECISCHTDVHQNTLSTNCASCHNTAVFSPAALFDHSKTSFPLKGKHRNVDCKSCHEVTVSNGQEFQRFSGVPFNSCVDCHDDVHNNRLGQNCKECHNEESFLSFSGKTSFNHNQTDFPLVGKHRGLNCASCHTMGDQVTAANVFMDYKGQNFNSCVTCHKDVHEGKFGTDCRQCHTEESFRSIKNLNRFEHDLTGFPLEGMHVEVDCKKCHQTKLTDPLPHNRCADCHDDFHKGQFVENGIMRDCAECHVVQGFSGSQFTVEKHNEGNFPLTGAHLATPCFSCHLKNEEWTFRNIGQQCNDCHVDVHEGFLSETYYPQKECTACHSTDMWASVDFEHSATGFELEGRHGLISCTSCHSPDTIAMQEIRVPFTGLESSCISCHDNIHGDQFEKTGKTDCTICHAFEAWKPSEFDHQTARFKLDGAHRNVECKECHQPECGPDGVVRVLYRTEKLECIHCHLN
jgi:hypothetical protein